jgi:membrane protein required for colicin V production
MNWLDIVILCLLGVGLIKGLYDGVIKQVVSLVALIVGIYLCSGVAKWLCDYLIQLDWFPQGAVVVASYFLGFIIIVGIIVLAGRIVHRIIDATPLSIFNHL